MLRHYFIIFALYFLVGSYSSQITSFSVIAGPDIKTLGNSIQDRKNEGYIYHVLDSLTKRPQAPNWAGGPNGEVFKASIKENALYFNASYDQGKTWASNVLIDSLPNTKKNPFSKVNGFAYTVCNTAMNRIYVCWSDAKFGVKNNDVFLTYSDDGGKTWLDRILITYYPNHKQQFMPRFAIDHSNGYLYFLYCSQRNFASGNNTDVYLSVSKDNGTTFTEHKLNEKAFAWNNALALGKYFSLTIDKGNIYATWMQPDPQKKLVIRAVVLSDVILRNVPVLPFVFDHSVKYVYDVRTHIPINLQPGKYSVFIYKASDPKFEMNAKPQVVNDGFIIDFQKLKLPKATYVAVLYNNTNADHVWIQEE
jgi:Neuraminidase (sialidase)